MSTILLDIMTSLEKQKNDRVLRTKSRPACQRQERRYYRESEVAPSTVFKNFPRAKLLQTRWTRSFPSFFATELALNAAKRSLASSWRPSWAHPGRNCFPNAPKRPSEEVKSNSSSRVVLCCEGERREWAGRAKAGWRITKTKVKRQRAMYMR